jgi:hypothetical protein
MEHSHISFADANGKKRLSRWLPLRDKQPVANRKYLWFSIRRITYWESQIFAICYQSAQMWPMITSQIGILIFLKDPKDSGTLFLLPFFHRLLLGFYWLLLKGLEWTRLHGQWTSRLQDRGIVPISEGLVFVRMSDCCLQGIQPCKCKGEGHQWAGNQVFR